jgi:carbon monoxide dehydrogenase subunit G
MSPLSKFLLFSAIALIVIVAGLWISGGKKDEYSAKIEINAQPSQIFPYFIDPEKAKAWMSGLEQIDEPLPLTEGYNNPPELMRTVVDTKGNRVSYNDTVIRFTLNEILTVQSNASGTVHTTIFQLEPLNQERTQFSYFVKTSYNGLARLMAPLHTSKLQDRINTDVRRLKELVEKNEPPLPQRETMEAIDPPEETSSAPEDAAAANDGSDEG